MITRRTFHKAAAGAGLASLGGLWLPGCNKSAKKEPGVVIGMIAKSQSNPVFLAARVGAEARAKELSAELGKPIKIDWRTPNDEDAQKQAEFDWLLAIMPIVTPCSFLADLLQPGNHKPLRLARPAPAAAL